MIFNKRHDCNLHGHRFEPRYSKGAANLKHFCFEQGPVDATLLLVDKLRDVKYEYDICVRCGKIIKKGEE